VTGRGENAAGAAGENDARRRLEYEGCEILEAHPLIHGHRLDFLVRHPVYGESFVEAKFWKPGDNSGKDTVKKAIADAYDLRECGETRAYILVISHRLRGLHREMLRRARKAGVIAAIYVIELTSYLDDEDDDEDDDE
jgi:hypothetical protein